MYLDSIHIKNFKSCYDTKLNLCSTVTLLVGENNSGKSNIIDALRLATTPLDKRRSRWFDRNDPSWGKENESIEITTHYKDLSELQKGQYITALDVSTGEVEYTTKFVPDYEKWRKSKLSYHAGKLKSTESEPEQRENICHVYLPPLRDVQRELDSSDGHKISRIIELLSEKTDVAGLISQANTSMRSLDSHTVVSNLSTKLQNHLTPLTQPVRGQTIKASFENEERLHRIIRSLRLKMAETGCNLGSLSDSGMGYANLVYIAMVILELENARDSELTLFLVEEPEAHLHPQLQVVLLDYLRLHAEESDKRGDTEEPAGRIQVIATTHSPNLTSITELENISVLRTQNFSEPVIESETESSVVRCSTKSVSIKDLSLTPEQSRKINQYLDATRCALLFARSIILVEGTSEAVLLPVFAKYSTFSFPSEKTWVRQFLGVTIVAVGSVDFSPYITLLLKKNAEGNRLADNLIILTDGDPDLDSEDEDIDTSIANRADTLDALATSLDAAANLKVFSSQFTLEADFLLDSGNHSVLQTIFNKQHPRSSQQWSDIISDTSPAQFFYRKLRKNRKYLKKGEFAHDLAKQIEDGESFTCPTYIKDAIKAAVNYSSESQDAQPPVHS